MVAKTSRRQDLEVHLGSNGQIVGRLYLGSGKRSAFSHDERWRLVRSLRETCNIYSDKVPLWEGLGRSRPFEVRTAGWPWANFPARQTSAMTRVTMAGVCRQHLHGACTSVCATAVYDSLDSFCFFFLFAS